MFGVFFFSVYILTVPLKKTCYYILYNFVVLLEMQIGLILQYDLFKIKFRNFVCLFCLFVFLGG